MDEIIKFEDVWIKISRIYEKEGTQPIMGYWGSYVPNAMSICYIVDIGIISASEAGLTDIKKLVYCIIDSDGYEYYDIKRAPEYGLNSIKGQTIPLYEKTDWGDTSLNASAWYVRFFIEKKSYIKVEFVVLTDGRGNFTKVKMNYEI